MPKPTHFKRRKIKNSTLVFICLIGVTTLAGYYGWLKHNQEGLGKVLFGSRKWRIYPDETSHLLFHPFDNHCKFPMLNTYAYDVAQWKHGERLRQLTCPYEDNDVATMDSEGYMYVHPHYFAGKNAVEGVTCKVIFLEGGLRGNKTNKNSAHKVREVAVLDAPENRRFLANGDVFRIRCEQENVPMFQKVFAGMRDFSREKNKLFLVDDTSSFDSYGRRRENRKTQQFSPNEDVQKTYSVDILAFDSVSRTLFMRHMPRTVETMNKFGYEFFYGYNKVGDNSNVNLVPILAGDLKEALRQPMLDNSSDINAEWILPLYARLDPDTLPFLWKTLKDRYNCSTMLNDDIVSAGRGLFHYPAKEFLPGFSYAPTDHYYRAYYLDVYEGTDETMCRDGTQIQREFIDLWRRFANRYKHKCHFGFSFITSLTHTRGHYLELVDEYVKSALENLYVTGALDNSISIIMGDHGNRISLIRYTYTGSIEERMPLMAIRLPTNFKHLYPIQYANFLTNKWKLISNFDIHQTLKEITLKYGSTELRTLKKEGRGISLFEEIPATRTCRQAYISENFCTCMIDRRSLIPEARDDKLAYIETIETWIEKNDLAWCVEPSSIAIENKPIILGPNPLARYSVRWKTKPESVDKARNGPPKMEFLYHEFLASVSSTSGGKIRLLFRIEEDTKHQNFAVPVTMQLLPQQPYMSVPYSVNYTVGYPQPVTTQIRPCPPALPALVRPQPVQCVQVVPQYAVVYRYPTAIPPTPVPVAVRIPQPAVPSTTVQVVAVPNRDASEYDSGVAFMDTSDPSLGVDVSLSLPSSPTSSVTSTTSPSPTINDLMEIGDLNTAFDGRDFDPADCEDEGSSALGSDFTRNPR
ncbi:hypothetical protein Q1695_011224 [Nippostrongylus brasiliensis]|nr:hypothetical protein Q1695_011224 [Nippostrongylus brasiliensis]